MIALYPGSFDPPHVGHVDVIRRAVSMAERVIVGVAVHPDKKSFLTIEERVACLKAITADLPQVSIVTYQDATVRCAQRLGCTVLVRGLRSAADLTHEIAMATINRDHGIETVFLSTRPEYSQISSSVVRMAIQAGMDVNAMVPEAVQKYVPTKRV